MLTELTSELTHFNPVNRLSNVKHSPFFTSHLVGRRVELRAAAMGHSFFLVVAIRNAEKPPFSNSAQETDRCRDFNMTRYQDMLSGVVLFPFGYLGPLVRSTSCAPNS